MYLWRVMSVALALGLLVSPQPLPTPQDRPHCFAETGFCVTGAFRDYWETNGGLASFGYPIGEPHVEQHEGWTGVVQWFERDRFEDHGSAGIMTGRLGVEVLAAQGHSWEEFPQVDSAPHGCVFFRETRHSLCDSFLTYWQTHGGLARLGYPISEAFLEQPHDSAAQLPVQYFERRRMEFHGDLAGTPFAILLSRLGAQLRPDRLLFSASVDRDNATLQERHDIYAINPDGSGLVNLTDHPADDRDPQWSPSGAEIVFVSNRSGATNVYRMRADGTDVTPLTTNTQPGLRYFLPQWSPDGSQVLFMSYVEQTLHPLPNDLLVVNREGTRVVNVSAPLGDDMVEISPHWIDNHTVLFQAAPRYQNFNLYTVSTESIIAKRITQHELNSYSILAVSPAGDQIASLVMRDEAPYGELQVMKSDGTETHTLPDSGGVAFEAAAWNPKGDELIFVTEHDGSQSIHRSDTAGDHPSVLPVNNDVGLRYRDLGWSPDGARISFVRNQNVVVLREDGGAIASILMHDPAWLTWSPQSTALAIADGNAIYVLHNDATLTRLTPVSSPVVSVMWQPTPYR
jgi:dipeptidyl aminopeptidase/acylaminoacyl peptidase